MAMYAFVWPAVELDERLLEKLWPFARRLPSFYKKYPRDPDEAGPSGINANNPESNEVDVSLHFIVYIINNIQVKTISVESPPQSQKDMAFPSQIPDPISADQRTYMLADPAEMVNEIYYRFFLYILGTR